MKDYIDRLKDLREDNDKTQKEIAELLGLNQSNYSKIERKMRGLSIENLVTLCHYYKVSADYILDIKL